MIRVYLKDIGPAGKTVEAAITSSEIGLGEKEYLYFPKPISIKAELKNFSGTVIVNVSAVGRFHSVCARSSEEIERDWKEDFTLDFEVDRNTEFIEIGEDIRQEIILRLPVTVLSDKEQKKADKENKARENKNFTMQEKPEDGTYQPFLNLKSIKKSKGAK